MLGRVQRDWRLGKTGPPEVVPVLGKVSRLVGARPCRVGKECLRCLWAVRVASRGPLETARLVRCGW